MNKLAEDLSQENRVHGLWPSNFDEITGTLENWKAQQVTKKEVIIWGNVFGDIHGRFVDGQLMHTSGIRNRAFKEGDIVVTRNNKYKLGKKSELNGK